MNTAIKPSQRQAKVNIEPVLQKVIKQAKKEHEELQEMFGVMGWGDLPDALKMEIKDDVAAMVDELQGQYSSCDPHVERRRQRVVYWVNNFKDGICSLKTAVDALRVRSL